MRKQQARTPRVVPWLALSGALALAGCGGAGKPSLAGAANAAERVYVAPGEHDELYAFMSGGFSGNVPVYGLPSGRLLAQVPALETLTKLWFRPDTHYAIDTALMFQEAVHTAILEVVDGLTEARGLRRLGEPERKPVLREFLS